MPLNCCHDRVISRIIKITVRTYTDTRYKPITQSHTFPVLQKVSGLYSLNSAPSLVHIQLSVLPALFPHICTSYSTLITPFSAICTALGTSKFVKTSYRHRHRHRSVTFNPEMSPSHLTVSAVYLGFLCNR